MSDSTLQGSCLCGAVAYQIDGKVGDLFYCHCEMCRKALGGAFAPLLEVSNKSFRFTRGESVIREYRSSDDAVRTFCGCCGASLQFKRDNRPGFHLVAGTLDSDPGRRPMAQIWSKTKAPWHPMQTDIPSYKTYPSQE